MFEISPALNVPRSTSRRSRAPHPPERCAPGPETVPVIGFDSAELREHTTWSAIRSPDARSAAWLNDSPECPLLRSHRLLHLGIMHARNPFQVMRPNLSGSFFLAGISGRGSLLTGGRWAPVRIGEACLLPPDSVNALRCEPGSAWSFLWVAYLEPTGVVPIATGMSPQLRTFDPHPLRCAVEGLSANLSEDQPALSMQHHWLELIHGLVRHFTSPLRVDDRIWKAWKSVSADISADWTLAKLAHASCLSAEHFRRLCSKALGRSPRQHLIHLRMGMAAELLATSDKTIETIAQEIGYDNPFAFSNAFLKWKGVRPSDYRGQQA